MFLVNETLVTVKCYGMHVYCTVRVRYHTKSVDKILGTFDALRARLPITHDLDNPIAPKINGNIDKPKLHSD